MISTFDVRPAPLDQQTLYEFSDERQFKLWNSNRRPLISIDAKYAKIKSESLENFRSSAVSNDTNWQLEGARSSGSSRITRTLMLFESLITYSYWLGAQCSQALDDNTRSPGKQILLASLRSSIGLPAIRKCLALSSPIIENVTSPAEITTFTVNVETIRLTNFPTLNQRKRLTATDVTFRGRDFALHLSNGLLDSLRA